MVANRITILKDLGQFDQAEGLINQLSRTQRLQQMLPKLPQDY